MKIYIPTCNKAIYLVEALLYSLKKYWYNYENYDIVILGYKKPKFDLDINVTFHSMNEDDPVKDWASDLKKYFESLDEEYFIYMNEDCPLSRNINEDLLHLFLNIISKNQEANIGRICLTQDISNRGHDVIQNHRDFDVIASHQDAEYRTSTQFSIWNVNYFLKYLRNDMTPWNFELQHPRNDGYKILGTRGKYCLDFYHLYRSGPTAPYHGTPPNWNASCYERKSLADNAEDYNFITEVMRKA